MGSLFGPSFEYPYFFHILATFACYPLRMKKNRKRRGRETPMAQQGKWSSIW